MAVWEGHRPQTSVSTGGITWNNPGNAYDVSSSIPETSTCATGTWPGATQDGFLLFYDFSDTLSQCDSRYDAGIRMQVASLAGSNPDYWQLQYSIDSGANWNTWVASAGRFSAASTWVASIARTIDVAQFQVKLNSTRVGGADTAGRVYIWDVYLVGSVLNPATNFKRYLSENLGLADDAERQAAYARAIADPLGFFDSGYAARSGDNFDRADGDIGANWEYWASCANSATVQSNMIGRAGGPGSDIKIYWKGDIPGPNQYARVQVASAQDGGLYFRMQPTSADNGYFFEHHDVEQRVTLYRGDNGVYTIIGSVGMTVGGGDLIEAWAYENQIACLVNGVPTIVASDATFPNGWTGLYMSGGILRLDNFDTGDFTPGIDYLLTSGPGGENFTRAIAESMGLTDEQFQVIAFGRALTETIGLTDARNVTKAMIRYLADTEGVTDGIQRSATFLRYVADQEGLTDSAWRGFTWALYFSEQMGRTDALAAAKGQQRILSEALGIADAANRYFTAKRYPGDTLGIADALIRKQDFVRKLAEALGVSDQAVRAALFSRQATEALGITDARSALKMLTRVLAEQLGITDAETRRISLGRIVTEAIGITDAQSRASALRRILADVEGISDAALRRGSFLRTLTEALGIDDRENVQKIISRAIADAVGITDYRFLQVSAPQLLRTIADTLSIADALTVSKLAVIVRFVADNLGVTDARWAAKQVRRILSETLGISDITDETKQIKRYLEELVGLTDDQERTALIIRRLTDTAGITDEAIGGLSQYILRIIADELGLTDSVSRVAALLTWLALTIAVDIPAIRSEVAGGADEITVDSEVLQPAIKTEVE